MGRLVILQPCKDLTETKLNWDTSPEKFLGVCSDTYETSACRHQADATWVAPWYPVSGKLGNDMKMANDNQIF